MFYLLIYKIKFFKNLNVFFDKNLPQNKYSSNFGSFFSKNSLYKHTYLDISFFVFFFISFFYSSNFLINNFLQNYKNLANKNDFLRRSYLYNTLSDNQHFFYKIFNNFYFTKKLKKIKKKNFFFINNFFLNLKFKTLKSTLKLKKINNFFSTQAFENINIKFFKKNNIFKNNFNFFLCFKKIAFIFNFVDRKKLLNFWFKKFKKFNYKSKQVNFNLNILNAFPKNFKKKILIFKKSDYYYFKFKNFFKINFFKINFFIFFENKYVFFKNKNGLKKTKKTSKYFFKKNRYLIKKIKNNFKQTFLTFASINDFFILNKYNSNRFNLNLFSNIHYSNNFNIIGFNNNFSTLLKKGNKFFDNSKNLLFYNNYYPIFFVQSNGKNLFFSKFKSSFDVDYINYIQFTTINYLEHFFKKNIFLKVSNNFFRKYQKDLHLKKIFEDYKFYQPKFMKNYLISDFLELLWYSFLLKDLTFISNWISKLMEIMNFKNHKKFLTFFQNLVKKHSNVFIDILKIKGFFFDIRGKVGVTGSSKKRHIFFKIGNLGKSTKGDKIEFNQNLVRTYSGVLGLTYIISY